MRLFHKEDECYIVAEGSFAFAKESFASLKGTIVDKRSDPIIEDGMSKYCGKCKIIYLYSCLSNFLVKLAVLLSTCTFQ